MSHTLIIKKNTAASKVQYVHQTHGAARGGVVSFVLAFILSFVLVYAPLSRAFADEGAVDDVVVTEAPVIAEEVSEDTVTEDERADIASEAVAETEPELVVEALAPEGPEENVPAVDAFFVEENPVTDTTEASTTAESVLVSPIPPPGTASSTDSLASTTSETASTTDTTSLPPSGSAGEVLPESEVSVAPEVETETATGTIDERAATTTPVQGEVINAVTNDENRFTFGLNECVSVGDGSFYCTERSSAPITVEDGVVSETDSDGDKEIYFINGGARIQVTSNTIDDLSPFYDPVSRRVVWHAYEGDRYQIFSYDVRSGETIQLTEASYNNMEPTAYDDATLWQAWLDGNWEIMMDEGGEVTRLTQNSTHDIAPHIRGDYILWQAYEGTSWHVKVYDRTTGLIDTVEGAAGVSVENPRFVLVYDSKNENGDVETLGYDFDSKRTVPLASTPAPVPEDVPEPEEDGEERALVQQNTVRTETRTEDGGAGGDGDDDDDVASSTESDMSKSASSTDIVSAFDIVIPAVVADDALDTVVDIAWTSIVSDNDEQ